MDQSDKDSDLKYERGTNHTSKYFACTFPFLPQALSPASDSGPKI